MDNKIFSTYTRWIILINVVVFIVLWVFLFPPEAKIIEGEEFLVPHLFIRSNVAISWMNILAGKVWTFLTNMFMHFGWGHLLMNMVSLLFIGSFVEKLIG